MSRVYSRILISNNLKMSCFRKKIFAMAVPLLLCQPLVAKTTKTTEAIKVSGKKTTSSKKKFKKQAQPKKIKREAVKKNDSLEQRLKKLCPIAIQDLDNSVTFELKGNREVSINGQPSGTAHWSIENNRLIIVTIDAVYYTFPIEIYGNSLLIDKTTPSVKNRYQWIVNVPD